jgi:hypothetical protein
MGGSFHGGILSWGKRIFHEGMPDFPAKLKKQSEIK